MKNLIIALTLMPLFLIPLNGADSIKPGAPAYADYGWKDVAAPRFAEAPRLAPGESLNLFQGALHAGKQVLWIIRTTTDGRETSALLAWNPRSGATRRVTVADGAAIRGLAWDPAAKQVMVRLRTDLHFLDGETLTERASKPFIKNNRSWSDMAVLDDRLYIIGDAGDYLDVYDRTSLQLKKSIAVGKKSIQRVIPFEGALLLWSSYWGATLHRFDPVSGTITATLHAAVPHRAFFKATAIERDRIGIFDLQETRVIDELIRSGDSLVNVHGGAQVCAGGRGYRYAPVRQRITATLVIEPPMDLPASSMVFEIPHRSTYTQEVTVESSAGTIVTDSWGNRYVTMTVGPFEKGMRREIEIYRGEITRYKTSFDFLSPNRPLAVDGSFERYLGDHPIYSLKDPLVAATHARVMAGLESYTKKIDAAHAFAATMKGVWDGKNEPVPQVLRNMHGGCNEHTRVIVAFLRLSGIPARYAWNHIWIDDDTKGFAIDHAIAEAWVTGIGWVPLEGLGKRAGALRPYLFFTVGFPESKKDRPRKTKPALSLKKHNGKIVWRALP